MIKRLYYQTLYYVPLDSSQFFNLMCLYVFIDMIAMQWIVFNFTSTSIPRKRILWLLIVKMFQMKKVELGFKLAHFFFTSGFFIYYLYNENYPALCLQALTYQVCKIWQDNWSFSNYKRKIFPGTSLPLPLQLGVSHWNLH